MTTVTAERSEPASPARTVAGAPVPLAALFLGRVVAGGFALFALGVAHAAGIYAATVPCFAVLSDGPPSGPALDAANWELAGLATLSFLWAAALIFLAWSYPARLPRWAVAVEIATAVVFGLALGRWLTSGLGQSFWIVAPMGTVSVALFGVPLWAGLRSVRRRVGAAGAGAPLPGWYRKLMGTALAAVIALPLVALSLGYSIEQLPVGTSYECQFSVD